MIWLFLLGIIWLAVYHEGFRKVVFWVGGISAGLWVSFFMIWLGCHGGLVAMLR